jgi:hypothetical protein
MGVAGEPTLLLLQSNLETSFDSGPRHQGYEPAVDMWKIIQINLMTLVSPYPA